MKKVLIVLLLLAVAGGLFAQSWSFSGRVDAGLGLINFADQDDMYFGLIAREQQENSVRAQLNVNGINANGTAGISTRIRAVAAPGNDWRDNFQFRWAYGWVSFSDDMVRVLGGRIQGNDFDTLDPISDGDTLYDAHGLFTYITPTDMFKLGLGAYTTQKMADFEIIDGITGYVGIGVGLPGLFDLAAQLSSAKEDVNALVSVSVGMLDNIPIEATAKVEKLSTFSDVGVMTFYEHVGINIIDNLSLNLASSQSMSQQEESDMYLRGWFWLTYGLGNIVPRLDLNYVTAGAWDPSFGLGINESFKVANYDKDFAYLTVSPSVQFRVTGSTWVELGYLFGMDMSSNEKAAIGTKNGGVNHAAFLDVRVSF